MRPRRSEGRLSTQDSDEGDAVGQGSCSFQGVPAGLGGEVMSKEVLLLLTTADYHLQVAAGPTADILDWAFGGREKKRKRKKMTRN